MSNRRRKAALGAATVITTAVAALAVTGTAQAATAGASVTAGRAVHSASATTATPELPAAVAAWPLVVQGARGERVYAIQYLLNARIGAGLATDGIFGPATAAAVRRFQGRFGLLVDGKVGTQTWTHLIVQVQTGSRGSAVAAVQHNLRYAYGFHLAVDGIFGPMTASAVRTFQAKFKIGVDGIVGPVTWNRLVVNER